MNDTFGDRMKMYEAVESDRRFMPMLPVIARMDGRGFHNFTRGMARPYDRIFSEAMIRTTLALVKETGACMGYTQSDEITLAWHSPVFKSKIWFDGRVMKMTSLLASRCSVIFNRVIVELGMDQKFVKREPVFDARAFNVPNLTEGANEFLWREQDATKNSISMAASTYYSHKELLHKTGNERQEMLFKKGINWNEYPTAFKRGTYVQKRKTVRPFSADELAKLPKKHKAQSDPNLMVERTSVSVLELPILSTIENREEVIFNGAEWIVA